MFQTFEISSDPSKGRERLQRLRAAMQDAGIDGYIVPRADEHQGEYVPESAERLKWLTGFSGSAGAALVLQDSAHIFVDGRYTLQVREQADMAMFRPQSLVDTTLARWIGEHLPAATRLGFDPWLHTISETAQLEKAVHRHDGMLVPVMRNLIDQIWADRPEPPAGEVTIHPLQHAGVTARTKLDQLVESMRREEADACFLTDPSSLAWAFNIRGRDVPHTPLALGFAMLRTDGDHVVFIDKRKLSMETEAYLTQLARIMPVSGMTGELVRAAKEGARVILDPQLCAEAVRRVIAAAGGTVIESRDPARLPRATKNAAEIDGARAAHKRDGAAMATFLHWFDNQKKGTIDEIGIVRKLEEVRVETGEKLNMPMRDLAFDTISGSGPNGAVVHYRVSDKTNRKLDGNELFLLDSGAQYDDGTTDITRTMAIGKPAKEMSARFTLVLKGMIAISRACFPKGTRGMDIDVLARQSLWQHGLDYAHGTGHGVGSYLSVHEGPQNISKRGTEPLLPGMIVSNEPGYYKPGVYGIRIENLILVREPEAMPEGDLPMMRFETLTLCPIDRRLIELDMLTAEEREWIDTYHARVLGEIGPMVDEPVRAWLEKATAPLVPAAPDSKPSGRKQGAPRKGGAEKPPADADGGPVESSAAAS